MMTNCENIPDEVFESIKAPVHGESGEGNR